MNTMNIPSLEEQLTLSLDGLDGLDGCGTFFIVVNYLVDATAHGIRTLDPSIEGFQQFGN